MKALLPMMILMFSFVVTGCYEDKKESSDVSDATEQSEADNSATAEE